MKARHTLLAERELLIHLAERMARHKPKPLHTEMAKRLHSLPHRPVWRRDSLMVAKRYLRVLLGGTWYHGGHHVARGEGGPALCNDERRHRWYPDRLDYLHPVNPA